jgi:hypothetical protein
MAENNRGDLAETSSAIVMPGGLHRENPRSLS